MGEKQRPLDVGQWLDSEAGTSVLDVRNSEVPETFINGRFDTMMARTAMFHQKHRFVENNGHDMGYRLALTIEELGELAAAVTKGKPKANLEEELADVLILILGHALAMEIDLETAFHKKMDAIMKRPSITGRLGVRVTEYVDN